MTVFRRFGVVTCALVLVLGVTVSAQFGRRTRTEVRQVPLTTISEPSAWGPANATTVTFTPFEFFQVTGGFNEIDEDDGMASCLSSFCYWVATLKLPSGASISGLELSGCDSDAAAEVISAVGFGPKVPTAEIDDATPIITSGVVATPGCGHANLTLPTPVTVDNNNWFYVVQVGANAGTNVKWNQVRVRYRLQVSPAPGTASFADVPVGHPQRQFIEALVAAGITGGCGGGNYCPDAPVTRGQLAVFLAAALGLHWPF